MYDILLFDADNTLFDFDTSAKSAYITTAKECGFPFSEREYSVYEKINLELWHKLERNEITKERLLLARFEEFFAKENITASPEQANRAYIDALSKEGTMYEGAKETLITLKNMGKRLFLITNGVKEVQQGRLEVSKTRHLFEEVFISEDIGYEKPSAKFFEIISGKIKNFEKSNSLVIGDSLHSDILGANNFSLPCCWFNPQNLSPYLDVKIDYEVHNYRELIALVEDKNRH